MAKQVRPRTSAKTAQTVDKPAWPADQVERWPLDKLTPYARNARTHSDAQVAQIAASIKEWGWTIPVLVDEEGLIIAGHGRVLAARKLKFTDVPVMVARGWSEAQKRAYTLADNKLTLNGEWDEALLKLELGDLKAADMSLATLGFSDADLNALFEETPEKTPDASPQLEGLSYSVVIRCTDEAQQHELLERLEGEGLTCEALIS